MIQGSIHQCTCPQKGISYSIEVSTFNNRVYLKSNGKTRVGLPTSSIDDLIKILQRIKDDV